jgi:hypothetical protein
MDEDCGSCNIEDCPNRKKLKFTPTEEPNGTECEDVQNDD